MALRWLTLEEMTEIWAGWLATGSAGRTAIEKVPLLAALLPKLDGGFAKILALRSSEDPRLRGLAEKAAALDAKHDGYVRGIYGALTALAPLSGAADELLGLRDKLFPEGLAHTQKSYRGEAGHAALVASQVGDITKERLKAVTLHKTNLLELYNQWQTVARQLGDLEKERAGLAQGSPSPARETYAARLTWLRLTKTFLSNAEVAGLDAETDNLLFSALHAAEQAAESRIRDGRPQPAPAPTPPSPAATTTGIA